MGRPAGPKPFANACLLEIVRSRLLERGPSKVWRRVNGKPDVVFSRSLPFVQFAIRAFGQQSIGYIGIRRSSKTMKHLRLQVLGGILSTIFEDTQTSLVNVMDLFPHRTSRDLGE